MSEKLKQKFQYTWSYLEKNLNSREFSEQEDTLFEEMGKDGWELVQILDLEETYKYYFKKNISK